MAKLIDLHQKTYVVCNSLKHIFVFQGTDAFSQSGLYSNHQDIGPRYSVNSVSDSFIN